MPDLSHKILIVDENKAGGDLKARMLRQAGCRTIETTNGLDALARMRARMPAVIVLSSVLPDIDRMRLCRRIKSDPETARIMVLQVSARRGSTDDRVAALEAGSDAYLTEPLEAREFIATVKMLLHAYE